MPFIYLVAVIFFISINLRPSITSVGPLLDVIQTELGMNGMMASLLTTLPVFCMGLFALLSIRLSNRLGNELSLMIAMLLIFAATLARMFASNSVLLLATALFSGIGIGIAGPLMSGFIKKHFPDKLGVTGVYSVSMVIGAALASSFAIPLYERLNHSWQYALGVWSSTALIAAVLLLPLVTKRKARSAAAVTATIFSRRPTNKRLYWFILFFGCMAAVFYSVTAWLAPLATATGLTSSQSGMVLMLFTVIQVPVSFFIPVLASRTGNRRTWLLVCGLSELIGIVLLLANSSPWIAAILLGIGAGGLFPLALLLPIEETDSMEEATSWSAMMQCWGFMFGSLGPLFFGLAVDAFHNFMLALMVILMIISLLLITVLKIGNRAKKAEQA